MKVNLTEEWPSFPTLSDVSNPYGCCLAIFYPSRLVLQMFSELARISSHHPSDGPPCLACGLGHATALTPHCGVIHYRVAASLPAGEGCRASSA